MREFLLEGKPRIMIESKLTGEICETDIWNWRRALNSIKYYGAREKIDIRTKASALINGLKKGYEDKYVKAWIKK